MYIKVKDILEVCNAKLIFGNEEEICENFSKDTREIKPGDIYIGIKGEKFDGSSFFEIALENGAKVCIIEDGLLRNAANLLSSEVSAFRPFV